MGSHFPPDTADGWAVLHQFFKIDWPSIQALDTNKRQQVVAELEKFLKTHADHTEEGQSAAFHVLGHKGELLLLHFRPQFVDCAQVELSIGRFELARYLTLSDSYVSVVELGMYHTTKKVIQGLIEKDLKPHSEEWKEAYEEKMGPHRDNLHERCFGDIPDSRYICFYPMDKRRGDAHNWYHESLDKRAELMMQHGMTGRRYAGKVRQIISGSIGFDDWEWGVDLFSDDTKHFKDLIYEMRFDDATSLYGEFGKFYLGVRIQADGAQQYFDGKLSE